MTLLETPTLLLILHRWYEVAIMGLFTSDILEQHPVVSGFCYILQLIWLLMRMVGVVTFSFLSYDSVQVYQVCFLWWALLIYLIEYFKFFFVCGGFSEIYTDGSHLIILKNMLDYSTVFVVFKIDKIEGDGSSFINNLS